jgi:3-hydroxybutyrate dehydrogenase
MAFRTILITGGGSGIGRGIAECLAVDGHTIIVTDLNAAAAAEVADAICTAGGDATSFALNVADGAAVRGAIAEHAPERVDVLINNAGLQHVAPLESFPEDKWDLLLQVMLNGPCRLTRALLPRMRAAGYGRVVNIGSIHSLVASPFKTAYVAAKHGLLGFAKVVALETADTDITINTICPSYVRTPLVDAQISAQAESHGISEEDVIREIMLQPMPKGAFISVEELAATVRYLMAHEARNLTGQTITIDGGWTVR